MPYPNIQLVGDKDPNFIALRDDIRDVARATEIQLRKVMEEALEKLPLLPMPAEDRQQVVVETAAKFIIGLVYVFTSVSELWDAQDRVREHRRLLN